MAQFKTLRVRLTGESPLLLHNGQLADPLNHEAKKIKELTGKRKKTDADYEELARREWYGSLYLDEKKQPCIPGEVVEGVLVSGAKKLKMGQQAKAGTYCVGNYPIQNGGADLSNIDKLWESGKYKKTVKAKVGAGSVMRTRPVFDLPWSVEAEITYDPAIVNESQVVEFLTADGNAIGDWRPKFGRFKAEKI